MKTKTTIIKTEIIKAKTIAVFLKTKLAFSGTNSSRTVFKIEPPSEEGSGIAVKIPIIKFMYPKSGFSATKNKAERIKFTAKPIEKTKHFLAVLKFPQSSIFIPKRFIVILLGWLLRLNKAKRCPISCKSENKIAAPAIWLLSKSKNAVSTEKKSGETKNFVLSTVNSIKTQGTPLGRYLCRLL